MNREIKFRAWDKARREWIADFTIDPDGTVRSTTYSHFGEPHTDISEQVDLIQFTGRLDSKERPIYEGDLLTFDWASDGTIPLLEVRFDSYCFAAKYGGANALWSSEDFKVIGNIHENPELLSAADRSNSEAGTRDEVVNEPTASMA